MHALICDLLVYLLDLKCNCVLFDSVFVLCLSVVAVVDIVFNVCVHVHVMFFSVYDELLLSLYIANMIV